MTVIITAAQAQPGDIIRDRDRNLWTRQHGRPDGQVFDLVCEFRPLDRSIVPSGRESVEAAVLDLLGPLELMMRGGESVGDKLSEPEPPGTIDFTWRLYGGKPWEEQEKWSRALGITVTDELMGKINERGGFYEVELACTLDTATGEITIRGAK
jgi:hypothetical protein